MLESYSSSYLEYSEADARYAPASRKQAISSQRTATENHILASLSLKDYKLLLPYLEYVALPVGRILYCAGGKQEYLYFLAEGLVSNCYLSEGGVSTEFAITGSEGVVGVALILGGITTPAEAVVLSAGYAYRLRAGVLTNEIRKQGSLSHFLLRYVLYVIGQTTQVAACNRHHSVYQRMCRHILSSLDRLDANELSITQEVIANMLGVRRETVTQAAGELHNEGLISYHRGHIVVLDHIGLEAGACECYATDKLERDHLLSAYQ